MTVFSNGWNHPFKKQYLQTCTDLFYFISEFCLCPTWNYKMINFLSEVLREALLRRVQQHENTSFCFLVREVNLKIVDS